MSEEDREYFEATQLCREPPRCPVCDRVYREMHEGPGECDDCFTRAVRAANSSKKVLPIVAESGCETIQHDAENVVANRGEVW